MMAGLFEAFFQNIYQPLIGKLFSVADVGYYVRAQTLQSAAISPTGSVPGTCNIPSIYHLSKTTNHVSMQAIRKIMTSAIFFHFPLMIGLILVAKPLIILLMTERWAPSIPYFQLLCIVGLFMANAYYSI